MSNELVGAIATIAFSAVAAVVSWVMSVAQSNVKVEYLEDKLKHMKNGNEKQEDEVYNAMQDLSIRLAKGEIERAELTRSIERLEAAKASKDTVENFKHEFAILRSDMDKRFDRIERLLQGSKIN